MERGEIDGVSFADFTTANHDVFAVVRCAKRNGRSLTTRAPTSTWFRNCSNAAIEFDDGERGVRLLPGHPGRAAMARRGGSPVRRRDAIEVVIGDIV